MQISLSVRESDDKGIDNSQKRPVKVELPPKT